MDFIYSELDTALLSVSPDTEKDIFYYGTVKSFPNLDTFPSLLSTFETQEITPELVEIGITCNISTDNYGEYEVVFYPAKYGNIVYINQNFVGINVLPGWQREFLIYKDQEFFMFHTKNLQYSDNSTFVFQLNVN